MQNTNEIRTVDYNLLIPVFTQVLRLANQPPHLIIKHLDFFTVFCTFEDLFKQATQNVSQEQFAPILKTLLTKTAGNVARDTMRNIAALTVKIMGDPDLYNNAHKKEYIAAMQVKVGLIQRAFIEIREEAKQAKIKSDQEKLKQHQQKKRQLFNAGLLSLIGIKKPELEILSPDKPKAAVTRHFWQISLFGASKPKTQMAKKESAQASPQKSSQSSGIWQFFSSCFPFRKKGKTENNNASIFSPIVSNNQT